MIDNQPHPNDQYTDAQLVERFLHLRNFVEAETEAQNKFLEPSLTAMQTIQAELHRRLLLRNPDWQPGMKASGTAGGGTFFLKTTDSVKMADRDAFYRGLIMDAVNANQPPAARMPPEEVFEDPFTDALLKLMHKFLTAHVAKEGVEEYQRSHSGSVPPGITIDQITKLQVRKT